MAKGFIPSAIVAVLLILAMANKAQSQSSTTSFTYDFYGDQPSTLIYQGHAHFPSDTTFLRLTQTDSAGVPQSGSIGRAIHSEPVQFWTGGAQSDFETTVNFIIRPKPGDNDPADGITFFIAPVGTTIPSGAGGGNLGIFGTSGNTSSLFAVEFDIYVNGAWDPSTRHAGIDIESRKSVKTIGIPNTLLGTQVTLRVNYVGATNVISVVVTANGYRNEMSYVYDLSSILPQQVQVGLSASTGENVAIHDVVSWYFTSTLVQQFSNGKAQGTKIRQIV